LIFGTKLRFAQPFLAKLKWTINWSLSPQGFIFKIWQIFQIFKLKSEKENCYMPEKQAICVGKGNVAFKIFCTIFLKKTTSSRTLFPQASEAYSTADPVF